MSNRMILTLAIIPIIALLVFVFLFRDEIFQELLKVHKLKLIAIFMSSVPAILLLDGYKAFKLAKLIELMPTHKIRSLPMGLVEVKGKIIPISNKKIISPIGNRECVYYIYNIYTIERNRGGSRKSIIYSESNSVPFYIQDDTGSIMVDPQKAIIDAKDLKLSIRIGGLEISSNPRIKELVTSKIFLSSLFIKDLNIEEYILEPNQEVYIIGTVKDNPYIEEATSEDRVKDKIIAYDHKTKIFLISTREEKSVVKLLKLSGLFQLVFGIITMTTIALTLLVI